MAVTLIIHPLPDTDLADEAAKVLRRDSPAQKLVHDRPAGDCRSEALHRTCMKKNAREAFASAGHIELTWYIFDTSVPRR